MPNPTAAANVPAAYDHDSPATAWFLAMTRSRMPAWVGQTLRRPGYLTPWRAPAERPIPAAV
jgi:hypothetical protein